MIVFDTSTHLPPSITERDLRRLGANMARSMRIKSSLKAGLAFVDEKEMRRLNKTFAGKNKSTDVLSFDAGRGAEKGYLGDIAICPAYAKREASRRSLSFDL